MAPGPNRSDQTYNYTNNNNFPRDPNAPKNYWVCCKTEEVQKLTKEARDQIIANLELAHEIRKQKAYHAAMGTKGETEQLQQNMVKMQQCIELLVANTTAKEAPEGIQRFRNNEQIKQINKKVINIRNFCRLAQDKNNKLLKNDSVKTHKNNKRSINEQIAQINKKVISIRKFCGLAQDKNSKLLKNDSAKTQKNNKRSQNSDNTLTRTIKTKNASDKRKQFYKTTSVNVANIQLYNTSNITNQSDLHILEKLQKQTHISNSEIQKKHNLTQQQLREICLSTLQKNLEQQLRQKCLFTMSHTNLIQLSKAQEKKSLSLTSLLLPSKNHPPSSNLTHLKPVNPLNKYNNKDNNTTTATTTTPTTATTTTTNTTTRTTPPPQQQCQQQQQQEQQQEQRQQQCQ